MVRTEKELLESLFGPLNGKENSVDATCNDVDIEKYRDADGFINVKNVKDINEIKKIFEIVDKKNYMEYLQTNKNHIHDLADALGYDLLSAGIEIPNNNITNETNKIVDELKSYCSPIEKANCCENNDAKESIYVEKEDKTMENKNQMVVLYNAGGMFNPLFYNAILYICTENYFPKCGVFTEDEIEPSDNVTTHILLPNIWGKIFADVADEFGRKIENGDEVFVIDPESFELIQITTPVDLWDFAMTKVQEEML